MHIASELGHIENMEVLISQRADVEARDAYEKTPLHEACMSGSLKAVQCLIRSQANVNAVMKDDKSYTALDLVEKILAGYQNDRLDPLSEKDSNQNLKREHKEFSEILQFLIKHGAQKYMPTLDSQEQLSGKKRKS